MMMLLLLLLLSVLLLLLLVLLSLLSIRVISPGHSLSGGDRFPVTCLETLHVDIDHLPRRV